MEVMCVVFQLSKCGFPPNTRGSSGEQSYGRDRAWVSKSLHGAELPSHRPHTTVTNMRLSRECEKKILYYFKLLLWASLQQTACSNTMTKKRHQFIYKKQLKFMLRQKKQCCNQIIHTKQKVTLGSPRSYASPVQTVTSHQPLLVSSTCSDHEPPSSVQEIHRTLQAALVFRCMAEKFHETISAFTT